ncbi:MAG: hypothetical protein ABMB14_05480 [Myxococcota bacterium]
MARVVVGVALAIGCAKPPPPEVYLPFSFEARPTSGEVRVVPALRLHDPVAADLRAYLGTQLPDSEQRLRIQRTHELTELSEAVGFALPGEVNGELGDTWPGQFRSSSYPMGSRQRVEEALRSRVGVDWALGEAARAIGGDAALISWMDELDAEPLTTRGLPGVVVDTAAGPVVVDSEDEPYLVSAQVGMALVAADGEVVVRYTDTYETVLSGSRGPAVAGRDLAHALAEEVALVWATDPRLLAGEPTR